MTFDLHTHHYRCGHAEGQIEDYIKSAIEKGLHYIGIADHSPYFYSEEDQLYPGIAMPISGFEAYVQEVLHLKDKYKDQIHVLLGVESDFFPQHVALYANYYKKYPFDYIIGSVHYVDDVNIFKQGRWDGLSEAEHIRVKETYYDMIQQSAKSGIFQVLGHIDAMKGFYPAFSDIPADHAIEQTLKVIGEAGVSIEVNTSGATKAVGGWYPSDRILERALHYGVDISFGSDAHVPSRIGEDFEKVKERLKDIGFKEMVYFVQKQKRVLPL